MKIHNQKGVGLIEVLVALLLLAIGVLGFVALQIKANQATEEAVNRVHATNIARNLAESIRINSKSVALSQYITAIASPSTVTEKTKCFTDFCTPIEKANFDIYQTYLLAKNLGMSMNMMNCPATTNNRKCIYIAWDKTTTTNTTQATNTTNACTVSTESGFSYQKNSTCIVLETYTW